MKQYLNLLEDILDNGIVKKDRTGVGTKSIFGSQLKFDLRNGFPIVTTKKVFFYSVISELLWFIEGSSNEHRLAEILRNKPYDQIPENQRKTIWTGNYQNQGIALGYSDGDLGPIYGKQWRDWTCLHNNGQGLHHDQLLDVINNIIKNPFDRRLIVSAWNVSQIKDMALPPCHVLYQFNVEPDEDGNPKYLNLSWYQRSVDTFLGLPFNIASYATLLCIVAKITKLTPKTLVFNGGDTHIYLNHTEQVKEQLTRKPYKLPDIYIPRINNLNDLDYVELKDFSLINYQCHESIKAPMAV